MTRSEPVDANWKPLYRVGAVAALTAVIVFRHNFAAELMQLGELGIIRGVPATPPSSALDWFALLQANKFIGLILLNLVDLVNYALLGLVFLALYGALRRVHNSAMLIATACSLVGIAVYFASNQAFAMLALSIKYAAATTGAQRSTFLAAGEALLAIDSPNPVHQGTGMYASFFLVVLAGLIASLVMLRSTAFNKATAVVGILANGIRLCGVAALALAPSIAWISIPIAAPFRVTWYVMIALRLLRLSRQAQ